jgi:beta-glucosidase/6-phospho-beta-glucosidase/beta-galactosidase
LHDLRSYVSASDAAPGFVAVPFPAKHPTMNSSWLKIGPEALYWGPRNVAKVWNAGEIYITENGCSATDVPAADGLVYDIDRIMFLRSYLTQLQRATSEGVPVRGYFHWSLMDNFEWADGFGTRFGLLYVDYATQQRTPKLRHRFTERSPRETGSCRVVAGGRSGPRSACSRSTSSCPLPTPTTSRPQPIRRRRFASTAVAPPT